MEEDLRGPSGYRQRPFFPVILHLLPWQGLKMNRGPIFSLVVKLSQIAV